MATIVQAPGAIFTLAAPTPAPTVVFSGTGGSLGNGNYSYKITFVTANGETLPSTNSTPASPGTATGSAALSAIPTGNAYVTARKIYRTAVGGGTWLLLATLNDNTTTTYADTAADGSLGAAAPTVSTSDPPTYIRTATGATVNVTQLTSLATAVTTTARAGAITLFSTVGAGATATFTLNNANIIATSNVIAWSNMLSATGVTPVSVNVSAIGTGSCTIACVNNDGANATKAAPVIYYLVL